MVVFGKQINWVGFMRATIKGGLFTRAPDCRCVSEDISQNNHVRLSLLG